MIKTYTLYIDPQDDFEIVKEKLAPYKGNKVTLVFPEENKYFKDEKNFLLILKLSKKFQIELSVFSTDIIYQNLAAKFGIELNDTLFEEDRAQVQKTRPVVGDIISSTRPEKKVVILRDGILSPTPEKEKKEIGAQKSQKEAEISTHETTSTKRNWGDIIFFICFGLLLIFGILYVIFWLPRVQIKVYPQVEEVNFDLAITAKKDGVLNIEERVVGAKILEEEKQIQKEYSSTGEEYREIKARGTITLFNEDSASHQFVPNTRFQTQDGKIFRAQNWINIPAGSPSKPATVLVEVVADQSGEEYNIDPTTFTLPGLQSYPTLFKKIYAKSEKPFDGGAKGNVKVITQDDISHANEDIQKEIESLKKELEDSIVKQIPDNFEFLKEAIVFNVGDVQFSQPAGSIAPSFKANISVKASLILPNTKEVTKIISDFISAQLILKDVKEVASSLEIKGNVLENNIKEGVMLFQIEGKEKVGLIFDKEKFINDIKGMTQDEFNEYINLEENQILIKAVSINYFPFWQNSIPKFPQRIFVDVSYEDFQPNK